VLVLRLAGLGFAAIQITLALRLLLPFVEVPGSLEGYVPTLVRVSDVLVAPFSALVEPYDLDPVLDELGGISRATLGAYAEGLDLGVAVAMVGWALVATFVLFVMRLVVRPAG
jgi:hypothetical protein